MTFESSTREQLGMFDIIAPEREISAFRVRSIIMPAGRTIGDNGCRYASFNVVVVTLSDAGGRDGWGYATIARDPAFERAAWFLGPTAHELDLAAAFETHWWPVLRGVSPEVVTQPAPVESPYEYFDGAVRNALWDLWAKARNLPLWRLLASDYGDVARAEVPSYASLLDYPLSGQEAAARARAHAAAGFRLVKVKIGADDVERDVERLLTVRRAVGDDVQISADANEKWTSNEASAALAALTKRGVRPAYIEDPLPRSDWSGFRELAELTDVPIVAHDYINTIDEVRRFTAKVPLSCLRASSDSVDFVLGCALHARECDLPLSVGNSFGELNAHVAAAFGIARHVEFSDLAWAPVLQTPIRPISGCLRLPDVAGAGLDPIAAVLEGLPPAG